MSKIKLSDSSAEYTADKIRVLDEIAHIRISPGMYISDITNPIHLVEEALDNALDECIGGYAKNINISIDTKTGRTSVSDDGRGIPIDKDVPITISTKLFSGAKFKGSKAVYSISSGKNGVGLVAVNALSTEFIISIYREKHAEFIFKDCKLHSKKIESYKEAKPYSTKITFTPDQHIFGSVLPDLRRINTRLKMASVELPNINICLEIDGAVTEIFNDKLTFFTKELLDQKVTDKNMLTMNFLAEEGAEKFEVMFGYEEDSAIMPRVQSAINLLPVDSGGTHVNIFLNIIRDYFVAKAKKLNFKIQPTDITVGLRAYLSLNLLNPDFSSQSKDKLINKAEDLIVLSNKLKKQIENHFDKCEDHLYKLLEFFANYRAKQESKNHKASSGSRRVSVKLTKLRECANPGGELFIVEGDSASGSIINARDAKKHAIFPLRGKIPNIVNKKDILNNAEVGELIHALGTGVGPNFDIKKLKYDKIIIAADNDYDGLHIAALVTMLMAILFPDIVKEGRLYIASAPLYAIRDSKKFRPLWSQEELDEARKMNYSIQYFKGLGEMNPGQIAASLLNEKQRRLLQIIYSENIDKLVELFSSSDKKRKLIE